LQRIKASQFNHVSLSSFGLSLEGGKDLDGNSYPDLIVGAPGNDMVAILRYKV